MYCNCLYCNRKIKINGYYLLYKKKIESKIICFECLFTILYPYYTILELIKKPKKITKILKLNIKLKDKKGSLVLFFFTKLYFNFQNINYDSIKNNSIDILFNNERVIIKNNYALINESFLKNINELIINYTKNNDNDIGVIILRVNALKLKDVLVYNLFLLKYNKLNLVNFNKNNLKINILNKAKDKGSMLRFPVYSYRCKTFHIFCLYAYLKYNLNNKRNFKCPICKQITLVINLILFKDLMIFVNNNYNIIHEMNNPFVILINKNLYLYENNNLVNKLIYEVDVKESISSNNEYNTIDKVNKLKESSYDISIMTINEVLILLNNITNKDDYLNNLLSNIIKISNNNLYLEIFLFIKYVYFFHENIKYKLINYYILNHYYIHNNEHYFFFKAFLYIYSNITNTLFTINYITKNINILPFQKLNLINICYKKLENIIEFNNINIIFKEIINKQIFS